MSFKKILPKGFSVSGIHSGIKRFNKDLALIYSKKPCKATGVFTTNKVKAAPVLVAKSTLKKGKPIHAVIINSGNANCCTGSYGIIDAKKMIHAVSEALKLQVSNVLVASTGIIGKRLDVAKIIDSVPLLVKKLSKKGIKALAKAILTTDKKLKIRTEKFSIGKKEIIISGACKGAGMIHPKMATMLCFIMTDANIDKDALKLALKESVTDTFNSITIDGDMSTNDAAILLANGQANNPVIKKGTKEFEAFFRAIEKVNSDLAKDIVKDGEGATKFVTIHVKGAKTDSDASCVAKAIAGSLLVKTSVHGQDGNWGRVAASVGSCNVKSVKPNKFEIWLDKVCMFKHGTFTHPAKSRIAKIYKRRNVKIMVNLNTGKKEKTFWTCDLSKRYVEINAHYTT